VKVGKMDKDITSQVKFGENDGECLPMTKCICGKEFDWWDFILSIYRDMASSCPSCKRKMYFRNRITIYEAIE
jgi:DNA-directed RNA polymerase subunit RPC12/RpoP